METPGEHRYYHRKVDWNFPGQLADSQFHTAAEPSRTSSIPIQANLWS